MPKQPKPGDNFINNGYVPRLGDVVHLNLNPAVGHEIMGPHYGLVVSHDGYNIGTGLCVACPITSKAGKLSGFELAIKTGRVDGAAILSALRLIDYQVRDVQFEDVAATSEVTEANRRIRLIFP